MKTLTKTTAAACLLAISALVGCGGPAYTPVTVSLEPSPDRAFYGVSLAFNSGTDVSDLEATANGVSSDGEVSGDIFVSGGGWTGVPSLRSQPAAFTWSAVNPEDGTLTLAVEDGAGAPLLVEIDADHNVTRCDFPRCDVEVMSLD